MVESIISDRQSLKSHDPEVSSWIGRLQQQNPALYDKLAAKGVLAMREKPDATTLGVFLDAFINTQGVKVKLSTKTVYGHTKRCLIEYFKRDKPLSEITPGDADEWRAWLTSSQDLAPNTVRRRCGIARQFFKAALRKRLIQENPFAEMQEGVGCIKVADREHFISREDSDAVLEDCPDNEWKLIFALSRFGGLRCPSEHLALKWGDINWAEGRIAVRSPKTEHHAGHESRVIPMFAELEPYFEKAWEQAQDAIDPKQVRLSEQPVIRRYRENNVNLRTQLLRILKKAGLNPWPKLFQNLRATRATELAAEYPAHVAAAWLGHSTLVAQKHYWQVTDADFEKAAEKCKHKCKKKGSVSSSTEQEAESKDSIVPADYSTLPECTGVQVGDTRLELVTPSLSS
ncbi:tyrosine-type recombinase/integrase [Bythopirellula polymerisocia]|uniref:tyrosine-type recombinase/integrase n=1 Tax=Bythopirellula polymerisocia TaxID=2528003 RepID=UPI003704492A